MTRRARSQNDAGGLPDVGQGVGSDDVDPRLGECLQLWTMVSARLLRIDMRALGVPITTRPHHPADANRHPRVTTGSGQAMQERDGGHVGRAEFGWTVSELCTPIRIGTPGGGFQQQTRARRAGNVRIAAVVLGEQVTATLPLNEAFFHHFDSKLDLARALVERYADADIAHLEVALATVDPLPQAADRLVSFVRIFEDSAEELMDAQSSCLYVAILTERQLVETGTTEGIGRAIAAWRRALSELIQEAVEAQRPDLRDELDPDALADHVFVTFEGAFILCRAEGEARHMRAQLRILRQLLEALFAGR